jgi:sec-independent protein translocase protein TatA
MIGDLFDSPWKILIVAVVLIVLFGSKKLPDAARSLGRSMRILKTEVGSLHEDQVTAGPSADDQLRRSGGPAGLCRDPPPLP